MSLENAPWERLPEYMHDRLRDFIEKGRDPGNFLYAVLTNNLKAAVAKGDDANRAALSDWVLFVTNYAPAQCWGTAKAVQEWQERGGLEGKPKGEAA